MARWKLPLLAAISCFAALVLADNQFTYTGSPVQGESFTITWTPGTYSKVDILLNSLTGFPYYVPTTSVPIASGIANSGSFVWNVPSDLSGFFSLSIARDFRFPVSFSPHFALGPNTFSTIVYPTSVPQSTACTSAIPAPTGANPILIPNRSSVLRVGFPTTIQWQPTSKNTVTLILNPAPSDSEDIASAVMLSNISNSGSFTWTPPADSTLTDNGGWYFTLVDDVTQEASESDSFNILEPSAMNSFVGPYPPPVVGQDHTFYWSPSSDPTVSILMIVDVPYGTNTTIAKNIKNTGSFVWSVPTSTIPGVWYFALVNDATGNADSKIEITIDATTPELCGPQTSDALSSLLASLNRTPTGTATTTTVNTNDPSYISMESVFASFSSARAATITRVTPHVSTTLDPSTTQPTTTGAGAITTPPTTLVTAVDGRVMESQIGGSVTVGNSIVVSTSKAAAAGGNGREMLPGAGGWPSVVELGIAVGGALLGFVGVF